MSYDLYLYSEPGPDARAAQQLGGLRDELLDWNYTSNCAAMWDRAMPETDGLDGFDGMKAADAAMVLRKGIARMEAAPDEYRALNPANGWGSFEGQRDALYRLLAAFVANPTARVGVSR